MNNKIRDTLNKLINRDDLSVKTTGLSNGLFETLSIIENCTGCKDKRANLDKFHKSINVIENCLFDPRGGRRNKKKDKDDDDDDTIIDELNLNKELFEINIKLSKEKLCEGCK